MNPLLSITIPTYNRAHLLKKNLIQLQSELHGIDDTLVEIIISDNCSPDSTQEVVEALIAEGLPIKYIRNASNFGWGFNFFQCFNRANGQYVLILSDDDLLADGALKIMISRLAKAQYGVLLLKAYGFDDDFRAERPSDSVTEQEFTDFNDFFASAVPQITLLSASCFNKSLIKDIDTSTIEPGNFGHLHFILRAAAAAKKNYYINDFLIASKRDNSSNYIYSKIFVEELWTLFDNYQQSLGLKSETLKKVGRKMLFTYYPADLLRLRLVESGEHKVALSDFSKKFGHNLLFKFWIVPTLVLPRILAICWGAMTVIIGKIANKESKVVFLFLWRKFKLKIKNRLM